MAAYNAETMLTMFCSAEGIKMTQRTYFYVKAHSFELGVTG